MSAEDIEKSVTGTPEPKAAEPSPDATADTAPVAAEPAALPPAGEPLPIEPVEYREKAAVGSVTPAPEAAAPGTTERTG
jgi:hypothetical protein